MDVTGLIAVVILNWNGWDDTLECVTSLRGQSRVPDWIIVVDNDSHDFSQQKVAALGPGVTLLRSGGNLGFAGGNNVGIRWALAHGASAVWLLNNDATADKGALDALWTTYRRNPHAGAIGTLIYDAARPSELQCWGGGWISLWTGRAREFAHEVDTSCIDYISGCSLFLPRHAMERCGLLDEGFFMYFEDAEISLRYRTCGMALAVAHEAVVYHKGASSTSPGRMQFAWRTQSLLRILKLHARSYGVALVISTVLRAGSLCLHRQWWQLTALFHDVAFYARAPDWRRDH